MDSACEHRYPYLETGLFTISEAALYARLPSVTLRRWLFGNGQGHKVVQGDQGDSSEKTVSFIDFVQALAIRAIRKEHNVSLQKIRQALEFAEGRYGILHPFARRHQTFLLGKELLICVDGHEDPILASGNAQGQMVKKEIVELYLRDLSFNHDGLAEKYSPSKFDVEINPRIRFGDPIIRSCGMSAYALWHAVDTEGGIAGAASAYGVDESAVIEACQYFDHLQGRHVA